MPATKKKSKAHELPKQAPKRTGKRGIGAQDEVIVTDTESFSAELEQPQEEQELLKTPENAKKPKQARLPTMHDSKIEVLQSLAEDYAEIRDKRQALTSEEVRLKNELLSEMHSRKRTSYVYGAVEIHIIVEKEKVRVKIAKDKED